MSVPTKYVHSFEDCQRLINQPYTRNQRRKVQRNTYVEARTDYTGEVYAYAVKYHATDIVTYYPDGTVKLANGGWQTNSTRDRLNTYSPTSIRVETHSGDWYVRFLGFQRYLWEDIAGRAISPDPPYGLRTSEGKAVEPYPDEVQHAPYGLFYATRNGRKDVVLRCKWYEKPVRVVRSRWSRQQGESSTVEGLSNILRGRLPDMATAMQLADAMTRVLTEKYGYRWRFVNFPSICKRAEYALGWITFADFKRGARRRYIQHRKQLARLVTRELLGGAQ